MPNRNSFTRRILVKFSTDASVLKENFFGENLLQPSNPPNPPNLSTLNLICLINFQTMLSTFTIACQKLHPNLYVTIFYCFFGSTRSSIFWVVRRLVGQSVLRSVNWSVCLLIEIQSIGATSLKLGG